MPWVIRGKSVRVGKLGRSAKTWFKPAAAFRDTYPSLTALLGRARVTPVRIGRNDYLLLGWTRRDRCSAGLLCRLPRKATKPCLHGDHVLLLTSFGGITERWNEPEELYLLSNLNSALTEEDSKPGTSWQE